MLSLLYLAVRALVRLLVSARRAGRVDGSEDLEILVLRDQLRVLQRTSSPPRLRVVDRILLAAASRVIPRHRADRVSLRTGAGVERVHRIRLQAQFFVRRNLGRR